MGCHVATQCYEMILLNEALMSMLQDLHLTACMIMLEHSQHDKVTVSAFMHALAVLMYVQVPAGAAGGPIWHTRQWHLAGALSEIKASYLQLLFNDRYQGHFCPCMLHT